MVVRCGRARLRRSNQRQRRPTAEKTLVDKSETRTAEAVAVATIAEGEADIFDLFALHRREVS